MQVPVFPALAVLPALWMYVSTSFGGSTYITKSTFGMSSPLDATSVATNTLNFYSLNLFNVTSLWFWAISPCITSMSLLIFSDNNKSFASALV